MSPLLTARRDAEVGKCKQESVGSQIRLHDDLRLQSSPEVVSWRTFGLMSPRGFLFCTSKWSMTAADFLFLLPS